MKAILLDPVRVKTRSLNHVVDGPQLVVWAGSGWEAYR